RPTGSGPRGAAGPRRTARSRMTPPGLRSTPAARRARPRCPTPTGCRSGRRRGAPRELVFDGMSTPALLRDLLTTAGPSGYECPAAEVWRTAARDFTSDVRGDVMGSSVAVVRGSGPAPLVAIVGHIDEIGLVVTHIDDEG